MYHKKIKFILKPTPFFVKKICFMAQNPMVINLSVHIFMINIDIDIGICSSGYWYDLSLKELL